MIENSNWMFSHTCLTFVCTKVVGYICIIVCLIFEYHCLLMWFKQHSINDWNVWCMVNSLCVYILLAFPCLLIACAIFFFYLFLSGTRHSSSCWRSCCWSWRSYTRSDNGTRRNCQWHWCCHSSRRLHQKSQDLSKTELFVLKSKYIYSVLI